MPPTHRAGAVVELAFKEHLGSHCEALQVGTRSTVNEQRGGTQWAHALARLSNTVHAAAPRTRPLLETIRSKTYLQIHETGKVDMGSLGHQLDEIGLEDPAIHIWKLRREGKHARIKYARDAATTRFRQDTTSVPSPPFAALPGSGCN